jgi:hypothetical protein
MRPVEKCGVDYVTEFESDHDGSSLISQSLDSHNLDSNRRPYEGEDLTTHTTPQSIKFCSMENVSKSA